MPSEPSTNFGMEPSWIPFLKEIFYSPALLSLRQFLQEEKQKGYIIYPSFKDLFKAFWLTHYSNVRVVLIGQDPYHGPGQAHGLSFSVPKGKPIPPSLKNIYKELAIDLQIPPKDHGCLEGWAKQGVLLLNTVLTVRAGEPGSHRNYGWETFTQGVLKVLCVKTEPIVFLLWGAFAATYEPMLIGHPQHCILKAAHPSPFSAYKGFFGCRHFSKTNLFLERLGRATIDWGQ